MNPQIERMLKLPPKQKLGLLLLLISFISILFFFGLYQPKHKELTALRLKYEDLTKQTSETQKLASNLPKFKRDYEQLQQELRQALTELPNQKEIPSLLASISGAGKSSGLEFLLFKPKPEEPKDFYAAVPVDISVSGTFYSLTDFFKAVSSLPRIVNISNVNVTDIKATKGTTVIKVNCLATTFRFLDKKELKDDKKAK